MSKLQKNEYGQQVTETGHALTATEVQYAYLDKQYGKKLTRKELTELANYITDMEHNTAMNNHREGLIAGRREGQAITSAKGQQHG